MTPRLSSSRLSHLLRRFARVRVLVIGDLMLDQFIWGRVERISPEAPVPVVHVTKESAHLGGAANVAHNIRSLGGQATVCGILGHDAAGRSMLRGMKAVGVSAAGTTMSRRSKTVCKTRIIAHSQQVVRFDQEQVRHDPPAQQRLHRFLRRHVWDYDAVVVSDYGKGVVTQELLETLRVARARRPFRLIVDPKKPNFPFYRDLTLATPNLLEAAQASGVEIVDGASLRAAGRLLLERWQAEAVLLTRGEHGMSLFTRPRGARHFATVARQVFDVTGAGDTVAATCALALAAGASLDEAALVANHAAGIVVGKVGTATVTPRELRNDLLRDE